MDEVSTTPQVVSHDARLIPAVLREKAVSIWGDDGRRWLEALPARVDAYCRKWSLTDLTFPTMSTSFVAFAHSPRHGHVALKIGYPHTEMASSMDALIRYAGNGCCAVHEAERSDYAMLLEVIEPATPLSAEPDFTRRVDAVAHLAATLPVPAGEDHCLLVYDTQIRTQFSQTRRIMTPDDGLAPYLDKAEALYREIHDGRRPLCVLHGDLHHENVFLTPSGACKAIDPQGWFGESVLDVGRFFQHEWGRHDAASVHERMRHLIEAFSRTLHEDPRIVAASCYLNSIRTACWSLGAPGRRVHLHENIHRMEWIERTFLPDGIPR